MEGFSKLHSSYYSRLRLIRSSSHFDNVPRLTLNTHSSQRGIDVDGDGRTFSGLTFKACHENRLIRILSAPHKACQRREGLQLNRRSAEINVGLVFAAVSDADKVPLADQIACSLGWNLVGDDSFRPNAFQNLGWDTESGHRAVRVSACVVRSVLLWLWRAAHLDLLYAGVPLVHLLHSEKQNIVELIDPSLQDRLQPEDPPAPRHDFAIDDISVALTTAERCAETPSAERGCWTLVRFGADKSAQQKEFRLNPAHLRDLHLPAFLALQYSEGFFQSFFPFLCIEKLIFPLIYSFPPRLCKRFFFSDNCSTQRSKLIISCPNRYIGILPVLWWDAASIPTSAGVWSPGLSLQRLHVEVLQSETGKKTNKQTTQPWRKRNTGWRNERKAFSPFAASPLTCHVAEMRIRDPAAELHDGRQHTVRLRQWQRRAGGFSSLLSGLRRTPLGDKRGSCR